MYLLNILTLFLFLCAGVQCGHQLSWLPCKFSDHRVLTNNEGARDVQQKERNAMLQFGHKDDTPINPDAITFLITESKLDLQSYLEDGDADHIDCVIHRSSADPDVKWPGQKSHEYNCWFSFTLTHRDSLFTVSGVLRYPSEHPPSGEETARNWPVIEDRETLFTTAAMIMKTQTPSVTSGLGFQKKLHCQFAVDHKRPNVTVRWHQQHYTDIFSHASHSGKTKGTGVDLRKLASGDLSYTLPFTKVLHAGTYTCSASVLPLFISLNIILQIQESPQVSLSVAPTLTLQEGEQKKVVCEAENYYPLDVHIVWSERDPEVSSQRVGAPLPKVLKNLLLSSHKHNTDKTFSLSGFFYLQASLEQSGRQFTCTVSHQSLRMPIKKSFILIVEEPSSLLFILTVCGFVVLLLVTLYFALSYLHQAKERLLAKPY
ncbi:tapasin-related protein-like isoform X2 [Dunckerocampus dactyliophorus]|uniref:tapasin-related protein-like isoform X2 n=1 Tax=Dunckerocampus dactyliophorus TaxID=161453 RepID=UPI00240648FD|nr:tapasin-related protein-like isoform X2 [Dunckerocampus dactyliophorus]